MDETTKRLNRQDLRRLVGRLDRLGLNSEQIKEWFVAELPVALRSVALRRGRRRGHTLGMAQANMNNEGQGV